MVAVVQYVYMGLCIKHTLLSSNTPCKLLIDNTLYPRSNFQKYWIYHAVIFGNMVIVLCIEKMSSS